MLLCDAAACYLSATDEGPELEIAFSTSDVRATYKDATLLPKWRAFQTIIYLEQDDGLHASSKIAAFDFDGCLANTTVKRVGADAWSLMHPSIPENLQSLYNDGYKLVIFTNGSNIERWKKSKQAAVDSKIGRLEQFINVAGVPIQQGDHSDADIKFAQAIGLRFYVPEEFFGKET
ncbi:hypothetical protein RND71_037937 [Anisodus tanguticus]|uniref:Uncharacterized protein n=1 Tax=Anisodus tanguticus TaxID=243964 RepID=A0AAE1QZK1_9SOLA|nr:hypothetical protein RND71_037937 [Anisodus tanguticus]